MPMTMSEDRIKTRFDKWDNDHNGVLERSDLEAEARSITRSLGSNENAPEAQKLLSAYRSMFDQLAKAAGVSSNGSITKEQFRQAVADLIEHSEQGFDKLLRPLAEGIVALCDKDANRMIDRQEFVAWTRALGLSDQEGADAFARIDTNGDGQLTVDELLGVMRAYHAGDLDVELIATR